MENLSYLLSLTSRHLKNCLDKNLMDYHITASQFSVLNQIANKNGSITSAEIASNLSSDKPTISGIIHRLEEKNILIKINHPQDKRSVYLKLTNDGLQLVHALRDISDQLNKEVFGVFNEFEINCIKEYFNRLLEKIEHLS